MVSGYGLTTSSHNGRKSVVGSGCMGKSSLVQRDRKGRKSMEHLLLPLESEPVQNEDLGRQKDASHLAVVKGDSQEV